MHSTYVLLYLLAIALFLAGGIIAITEKVWPVALVALGLVAAVAVPLIALTQ